MKDHQKPQSTTQAEELLDELESIKSLLDDDELDSIPLLEEMIDDAPAVVPEPLEIDVDDSPSLDAPSKLPGQQGLFQEPQTPNKNPAKPSNDNPFLPKHIRERLGSSAGYVQELEQQQRSLEQQSLTMPFSHKVPSALEGEYDLASTSLQKATANPDALIDSLVKQYLPIIEKELRIQLKKIADQNE